jgi:hypothetical protein
VNITTQTLSQLLAQSPIASFGDATATIGGLSTSFFGGGMGGLGLAKPINLAHNLQPGQPLSSAIGETLGRAFPDAATRIAISPALKLGYQDAGQYQSMDQYSQYIQHLSNSIMGTDGYFGVHFSSHNNTIDVWDGTQALYAGQIDALDLIGQPTWIDYLKVNIKTVMRSDIHLGGTITLPPTLMTIQPEAAYIGGSSPQRTNLSFQGTFVVTKVIHIGDFRNPDSANWTTNIEATVQGAPSDQMTGDL